MFYCKSGTSGKLLIDYFGKLKDANVEGFRQKLIKAKRTQYLLELSIIEEKNKDLGKQITCPD